MKKLYFQALKQEKKSIWQKTELLNYQQWFHAEVIFEFICFGFNNPPEQR